jgi:hypothetical protein
MYLICGSLRQVSAAGISPADVPLVPVETRDFVDVAARAGELRCRAPVRLALLPGNFATAASAAELRYHKAAPEVRSAWQRIGLEDEGPSAGSDPITVHRSSFIVSEPHVPLVAFFGRELRSGSARLVTYALGAVASVLSAHPGEAGAPEIRFDAIVERPGRGGYACIECRGDACELVELAGTVREILMGNPSRGMDDDEGV